MSGNKHNFLKLKITGLFLGLFVFGWFVLASRDTSKIKARLAKEPLESGSSQNSEQILSQSTEGSTPVAEEKISEQKTVSEEVHKGVVTTEPAKEEPVVAQANSLKDSLMVRMDSLKAGVTIVDAEQPEVQTTTS